MLSGSLQNVCKLVNEFRLLSTGHVRPFFHLVENRLGFWDIHFFDLDLAIGLQCRLRGGRWAM